ncbi:MAG: CoA transferase, partial [Gammaproteobacteria bacterium]
MSVADDRPLAGYLVVSIEQAIAAPYCTRLMADQGARVIKVERPDGGDFARSYDTRVRGEASHFIWCNRSKESLALDLKDADSVAKLRKLIDRADVFIQNLAPGAVDKLGLAPDQLRQTNPRLVTCSISGFGDSGPYGNKKAYDLLIQAESGFLSTTGTADAPAKAGISIADICAGVTAYHTILAALLKRGRTGQG